MAATPGYQVPTNTARRGWFGRNWKWAVPLLLLILIAGGAAVALAPHVARRNSPAFQMIVVELRRNPRVIEQVGEPADVGNLLHLPAGERDNVLRKASFTFPWAGPKGKVEVSSQVREVGGQWGISSLEMVKADGTKVSLTADIQDSSGSDTPKFDPNAGAKSPDAASKPKPGDMDVKIEVPPGPQ